MNKEELRKKYLNIRRKIVNKDNKSNDIVSSIKELSIYKNSKVIALYYPLENEVDITSLIYDALNRNKIVLLPKIIDDKKMIFVQINSLLDVRKTNHFSLVEPISNNEFTSDIDLMILPCVCASKTYYRIGYGRGYYDYYLSDHNVSNKVVVTFKECLLEDDSFKSEFDIKGDIIISNK